MQDLIDAPVDQSAYNVPTKQRRSNDFRFFPSDVIGVTFNDNGVKLVFGIEEMDGSVTEQAGVFTPLAAAKLLSIILNSAISRYEQINQREIQIDPAKRAAIEALFTPPADSPEAES